MSSVPTNNTEFELPSTYDTNAIQSYIPPYIKPNSWQPWNSTDPCPAGYTCTSMGSKSLGAFSCDEMSRIAVEVFGFGNILAGIYCPENETSLLNCPVGSYCPDSSTRMDCPAGTFCLYKTVSPTLEGGGRDCDRCNEGSTSKRLSKSQLITQWVIFAILLLILIIKIIKRKSGIDKEMLKKALNIDSVRKEKEVEEGGGLQMIVQQQEQEKYNKLRPKLEVIADRLAKIRSSESSSNSQPPPPQDMTSLQNGGSILFMSATGDIMFDVNEFFDVLDTSKDGLLSFNEINKVMCLGDEQLGAFIANMKSRSSPAQRSGNADTVSRATFVKCFLDALADAAHLVTTSEEAEALFHQIVDEIGSTAAGDDGEILIHIEKLYMSPSLSSFLSDLQIYGIVSRFKKQQLLHISQKEFVKYYPSFLREVTQPGFMSSRILGKNEQEVEGRGLDVTFENLSLAVTVGKKQVNVVDNVTGRLVSNTMTAVMGGSGSGKSSLLNALCGRAHYGQVNGNVLINGNKSKIEEHKGVIGFVPQEDIVYSDLTVRENLMYAGRLQLPAGTTNEEISDLADATLAALGLCRIANSLVGDARRRGVSGGEKKRVNIGLELMKKPKILFLDEPTSGLDSRGAFVVMESLKRLVTSEGMTVATVIHQPRTDIYDMFDSVFLLGVGGRTVYHGPSNKCKAYFENIGFHMNEGESQADWFLDISSGDVVSDDDIEVGDDGDEDSPLIKDKPSNEDASLVKARLAREKLYQQYSVHFENLPSSAKEEYFNPPKPFALPIMPKPVPGWHQLLIQLRRNCLLTWRNRDARQIDGGILIIAIFLMTLLGGEKISSFDHNPTALMWMKFIASDYDASEMLPIVFMYALQGINTALSYAMLVGIIMSVLIGLNASKVITEKKLEFYREAQSGVNVTAYYLAAGVTSTVEQGLLAIIGSVVAYLVLKPSTSYLVYLWNFFMISWLTVSWALLLSICVPIESVSTVIGFWNAFFGLLFCGKLPPGLYKDLYDKPVLAVFAAFVSPLRFFVEGLGVSTAKCLPVQSGFPISDDAFSYDKFGDKYPYWQSSTYMAHTDLGSAEVTGCEGWFWWVGASFAIGITIRIVAGIAIHFVGRAKQGKKPFIKEVTDDFYKCRAGTRSIFQSFILRGICVFIVFACFMTLSCWLILRDNNVAQR